MEHKIKLIYHRHFKLKTMSVKTIGSTPFFYHFIVAWAIVISACSFSASNTVGEELIADTPGKYSGGNGIVFKNMLGINVFEWDFFQKNKGYSLSVYEPRMKLINGFAGIRHYMDWEKIESIQGKYTFNPTHNGSWNYDVIYERCKQDGIEVLVCLKTIPKWLMESYPEHERDLENIPMPYGADRANPSSYTLQAKAAFQFAARYGKNANIDPSLLAVYGEPRWTNDPPNKTKVGLGLVNYLECDNERDKWWKGKKAEQTPEEYAANLSAFYDGHKGKLGKDVGVKTADSTMKVVIGGLSVADPKYIVGIINWCKENRGIKADGQVDLCFDIINYHLYNNDKNEINQQGKSARGVAPERSNAGEIAESFVKMAKESAGGLPVWVTETGYDINSKSPQRAIPINDKSAEITQADWILRTSLLYARHGIERVDYYQLNDLDINSSTQYASSGLTENGERRPAADYIVQAKNLLGDFHYSRTIHQDPIVDLYELDEKQIYVLTVPDEKGRTANYELTIPTGKKVVIHTLQVGQETTNQESVQVQNDKLLVPVSETPIFVEIL